MAVGHLAGYRSAFMARIVNRKLFLYEVLLQLFPVFKGARRRTASADSVGFQSETP